MELMPFIMLFAGAATVLVLMVFAFAGPSPARARERRLSAVRARHSDSSNALVEAQMRRITASRGNKMDAAAMRFLPRPALLKKRLAMTGKTWTVGQYGMATLGITVIVGMLLWLFIIFRGLRSRLAVESRGNLPRDAGGTWQAEFI